MTDDRDEGTVVENILSYALVFGPLTLLTGLVFGWGEALRGLALLGVAGGVAILVAILGRRLSPTLVQRLPLPAWMPPRRLIRLAFYVAWAIGVGLTLGWVMTLAIAGGLGFLWLIEWSPPPEATRE